MQPRFVKLFKIEQCCYQAAFNIYIPNFVAACCTGCDAMCWVFCDEMQTCRSQVECFGIRPSLSDIYPSQPKILEGRKNASECGFDAIFNDSSPKSCALPSAFSTHFSTFRRPNQFVHTLESASKTRPETLVRPSQKFGQNFVWEG